MAISTTSIYTSLTDAIRMISRLMTMRQDHLSKEDALIVAAVETGVPALSAARDLMDRFHNMLRGRDAGALAPWVADTDGSLLASLGNGVKADSLRQWQR